MEGSPLGRGGRVDGRQRREVENSAGVKRQSKAGEIEHRIE